ncbi:kinase domain protein (macronuclear) [Tetrahymena thermophila SB210]|uniref:Kinase domain protein n=1 Tax=Tetrahymena thermophila (strain SB210) TaxID=312017 RepID=W7XHH5_TETTS|nr:kinase domain protein [Tetrahymena thermophila SB210]EWS73811.1 kinase domain protein [Tetrahymena thermophila SB210]|eukprot:XP_012653634.1 kinase domain protein [Tetrahymena thermophila SB210]
MGQNQLKSKKSIEFYQQLVNGISEQIPEDCQIQKHGLKEIIKLILNQKKQFQNFEYLNSGAYALVLKAQNIKSNRMVALKFLTCTSKEGLKGIESLKKEYELLQKFSQSDFLVNVYDCFYLMDEDVEVDKNGNKKPKEKSFFVTEMELCEQNLKQLFDYLRNTQLPSQEIKEIIAIQMLEGLNTLHTKNIMHRDIKPHNFLVCPSQTYGFTIKICDLGFASAITKSKTHYPSKKGTEAYFAPEVENGESRIQSDLFSLGLVLLELDNLNVLNQNWIGFEIKREIYQGEGIASKYQIDRNSNIYKIVEICLKPNYLERTTSGDLLSELIKLHGKPLKFTLSSMILEEQIPQQAQQIFNQINELEKKKQTQFEKDAQILIDNTDSRIMKRDTNQQFTKVEILSKLLKSLYEEKKYAKNFQILNFGSFGMVLSTKKVKFNNKEIVLKIQKIVNEQEIQNEIRIMQQLKTPLVVQLYDNYVIEQATAPERYVVFELEKCSCSLQEYLERQGKEKEFSDEEKLDIAIQVIDSVNYIHCFNIIHRDIKPDNFLVCLDGNQLEIKLCDFGLSAQLEQNCEQIETLDMVGNWAYMAPEILAKNDDQNKIYSKKSDSYSVGLLLSLLDNYLILKEQTGATFMNMTSKQYEEPFKKQKINIKENTEIFKFIKQLVVWERVKRDSLSIIVEQNSNKFKSNQNDMKQIISQHYLGPLKNVEAINIGSIAPLLTQNQIQIQDIKQIKINRMENLHKIREFQNIEINLSENNIGDEGSKNLGKSITLCKNITTLTLNLSQNNIGALGSKKLGTQITECNNITTLMLSLSYNNIGDEGTKDLGTRIAQCNNITTLTLNLSDNKIGALCAKDLGTSIALCKNITTLTLNLSYNNIGDEGIKDLGTNIVQWKNITNLTLNLKSNKIGVKGVKDLGTSIALWKYITALTLDLQSNNIDAQGVKDLGTGIAQCEKITTLQFILDYNNIGDEGAKDLGTYVVLWKNITNLTLNLKSNKIGELGVKDLVTGIAEQKKITTLTLDLRSNKFGDNGVEDLGKGIAKSENITTLTLDLSFNNIGDKGAEYLGPQIANWINISTLTLNLQGNNIDKGAFFLGTGISFSKNITTLTLNLVDNKMNDYGVKYLAQGIGQCKNITTLMLDLRSNNIQDEGANDLGRGIAQCQNITTLMLDLRLDEQQCIQLENSLSKQLQKAEITIF